MKSFVLALVAGAIALLPAVAEAHGPSRQKVEKSVEINAPADKVWAVVGDFANLSWMEGVEKVESSGNAVGAKRTITFAGGETLTQVIDKYDATKMTVTYRNEPDNVKVLPAGNDSARFTVKDAGGGKSTLSWWNAFYRGYPNNDPPPELNDEAAVKAVTDLVEKNLPALKAKIESGS